MLHLVPAAHLYHTGCNIEEVSKELSLVIRRDKLADDFCGVPNVLSTPLLQVRQA